MTKAELKKRNHHAFVRGCVRKVKYMSERSAIRAVKAMTAEGKLGLESYKCRFCHLFHVGRDGGVVSDHIVSEKEEQ